MKLKKRKAIIQFKPFTKKQLKVLTWWTPDSPYKDARGIIADGAIRSGKTLMMSMSFGLWAMNNFNGKQFGMAGKTIASFRRNVLGAFKQVMETRGYTVKERRNDNMLIISKGDIENYFYLFGGKDEGSQDLVQGLTAAGFFFDEVALMPQSFVNQAAGRLSETGAKLWFNCNPEGPFHWFKTEFIDMRESKKLFRLHFNMYDNPSLTEERHEYYEEMYPSGVFRSRYILGKWVRSEGVIYDNFNREEMVVDSDKIRHFHPTKNYVSIDYGTQNATVFKMWRLCKDDNKWYCVKEYYYSGRETNIQKTDEEYLADLNEFVDELIHYKEFDPYKREYVEKTDKYGRVTIILDPSAASFRATLKKDGYKIKKANNSVLDGIRVQAVLMNSGIIKWYDNNTHTFKEIESYVWDETPTKKGKDQPLKESDHCMDADRYFCYTILRKAAGGVNVWK